MKEERFKWSIPSQENLRNRLIGFDKDSMNERIERLEFLEEEFGPPTGMLLPGGMPALISLHEMKTAYLNAMEFSVVFSAHVFVEQTLGGFLIMAGHDQDAEGGLGAIIRKSVQLRGIDGAVADRLNNLRKIRISYFHAHVGMKDRSFMGRLKASGHFDTEEMVKNDSKEAIKIVVDLLRYQNPDWNPWPNDTELKN